MAASLKGIDPVLKNYIKSNRLVDVYEALLSGLAVMCPDDPYQFIIDRLNCLLKHPNAQIQWDMFIDSNKRPPRKLITDSNLEYIFNFEEESQPTPEMLSMAYEHYNKWLLRSTFESWMRYYLMRNVRNEQFLESSRKACLFYVQNILRRRFHAWQQWLFIRKQRQQLAYDKLRHVADISVGRVIFGAWHNVTLDAKKTREYFERLERGEKMDEEDTFTDHATGEARDDISMLPRKVALKIFSELRVPDLAQCACVCRAWNGLTQATSLCSRLDLTRSADKVSNRVLAKLLARCRPYLVRLNLRGCYKITTTAFLCIRECRNLQDLNLSECTAVNDEAVRMVVEGCAILLFLNISHTNITDATLRAIAKNCVNLQYLSVAFCQNFTDKGLSYLARGKGARRLIHLDLSGCVQLTPDGFAYLSLGCQELKSILLNYIISLNDDCIESLALTCNKLSQFSVLGSPNLTDNAFKMVAKNGSLRTLKVESNQLISDVTFKQISKSCMDLEHLYLVDCQRITDHSVKMLTSVCKNLTVINLADCVRISDMGVRCIADNSCASQIRELNLTNCVRITDMAVMIVIKKCLHLAYLSVCFCEHITESGIELLGQMHSLTSLDVSGCNCGDQGVSALGNNTRFKDINFSECITISDLGLQKFAQQCKEIERLNLSHCQLLTDSAIKNLAFHCKMLTYLNLAGCKLLTDLSVQYLSGVCHYLLYLDISGCLLLTDKCLKHLRNGCKRLKVLVMKYCGNINKLAVQKMGRYVEEIDFNSENIPGYYEYAT